MRVRHWLQNLPAEVFSQWCKRAMGERPLSNRMGSPRSPSFSQLAPAPGILNVLSLTTSDITVRITSWKIRFFSLNVYDLYDPGSPQDPVLALSLRADEDKDSKAGGIGRRRSSAVRQVELGRTARRKNAGKNCR